MPQNSYMLPQGPQSGGLQAPQQAPQFGGISGAPGMQFSPLSPGFGGGFGQLGPNQFRGANGGIQGLGQHAQQMLQQGRGIGQFGAQGMPQLGGGPSPSLLGQYVGQPGGQDMINRLQGAMPPPPQAGGAPQLEELRSAMQGVSQGPQPVPQPAQGLQAAQGPMTMANQQARHGIVNTAGIRPMPQSGRPMPGKPMVPGVGNGVQAQGRGGIDVSSGPAPSGFGGAVAGALTPGVNAQQSGPQVAMGGQQGGAIGQIRRPFANPQFQRQAVARGAARVGRQGRG